jgi:hypothetical protein
MTSSYQTGIKYRIGVYVIDSNDRRMQSVTYHLPMQGLRISGAISLFPPMFSRAQSQLSCHYSRYTLDGPLCFSVGSSFEIVQQVRLPAALIDCYLCESTWSLFFRRLDSSLFKNSARVSSLMNYIKVSMRLGSVSEVFKLSSRIRTLRSS